MSNALRIRMFCTGTLATLAFVATPSRAAETSPAAPGFTNVTKESGIADIVAKQYAFMAKVLAEKGNPEYKDWWLSGVELMDLDGDGTLDLHLAGHGQMGAAAWNDGKGHFTAVDPKAEIKRGKGVTNDIPLPAASVGVFTTLTKTASPTSWPRGTTVGGWSIATTAPPEPLDRRVPLRRGISRRTIQASTLSAGPCALPTSITTGLWIT